MIVTGQVFSFLAAITLAYSTFNKSKNKMIFWQIVDSMLNAIANVFLFSFSGAITNVFTSIRNMLQVKNKFDKKMMILFCLFVIIIGIYVNNKGIIGLLPIIASIEYTILMYKFKTAQKMRIALIINLILWSIYDFTIKSYPMFTMDLIIICISFINIIRFKEIRE